MRIVGGGAFTQAIQLRMDLLRCKAGVLRRDRTGGSLPSSSSNDCPGFKREPKKGCEPTRVSIFTQSTQPPPDYCGSGFGSVDGGGDRGVVPSRSVAPPGKLKDGASGSE